MREYQEGCRRPMLTGQPRFLGRTFAAAECISSRAKAVRAWQRQTEL